MLEKLTQTQIIFRYILAFYCFHHFSLVFIFNDLWKVPLHLLNTILDLLVGEELQGGGVSRPDILDRLRLRYFPLSGDNCGSDLKAQFLEETDKNVGETREELAVELQCFLKGGIARGRFARSFLNEDNTASGELVRNPRKYLPQIVDREMVDCPLDEKFVVVNLSL